MEHNTINNFKTLAGKYNSKLIGITKYQDENTIWNAYNAGLKIFGENKAQDLKKRHESFPDDIEWHMVGHLQRNKVKYIAPFVACVHSVDSLKLAKEINKEAAKNNRIITCLLQLHIANEESKFGLSFEEADEILQSDVIKKLSNIEIKGLMGIATNTNNESQIRNEFRQLKKFIDEYKNNLSNINLKELSMGMSNDYQIALEEGSTMLRIGSALFK